MVAELCGVLDGVMPHQIVRNMTWPEADWVMEHRGLIRWQRDRLQVEANFANVGDESVERIIKQYEARREGRELHQDKKAERRAYAFAITAAPWLGEPDRSGPAKIAPEPMPNMAPEIARDIIAWATSEADAETYAADVASILYPLQAAADMPNTQNGLARRVYVTRRGVRIVLFGAIVKGDRITARAVFVSAPTGLWQIRIDGELYKFPKIPRRGFYTARIELPLA